MIFADRGELALAITENRLQLDAPMSSWSVPTPLSRGGNMPSRCTIFQMTPVQKVHHEAAEIAVLVIKRVVALSS